MLISNATENDKQKPLVISKYPRCFHKSFDPNVLCDYYYNTKAWMTLAIFEDWLKKLNNRIKITNIDRKILLFVDNAKGHHVDTVNYSNIRV